MKYVSCDTETTGLHNRGPHAILQISLVVEDTNEIRPIEELPCLNLIVKHKNVVGEPYALAMNHWLLDIIAGRTECPKTFKLIEPEELSGEIHDFLDEHLGQDNRANFAGKNFASFDIDFLPPSVQNRVRHRVIDPAILFVDWEEDATLPNLGLVKNRAALGDEVTHDAYEDAMDVIEVLRTQYT